MHILQPKHSKLNEKEAQDLLTKLNVSKSQLPKIFSTDVALKEEFVVGDIVKIDRKGENTTTTYYRVVV